MGKLFEPTRGMRLKNQIRMSALYHDVSLILNTSFYFTIFFSLIRLLFQFVFIVPSFGRPQCDFVNSGATHHFHHSGG